MLEKFHQDSFQSYYHPVTSSWKEFRRHDNAIAYRGGKGYNYSIWKYNTLKINIHIMEFISKLIVEYQEQCNTYDSEKDKIEKKIARLQKKYDKLQRPHWTKHFVRPIINEVASRTPDITWEIGETLHTLGLRCEYLVFGTTKDGHTVGITFTPGINAPHYDTGKYHSKSPFQTLQDLNGLNNITKPIESIDELIGMVRKDEQEAILYAQKAQIPEQE